jgi:hypothetical protein
MIFTEYISKPGDRWDLISKKAYGTIDQVTLEDGTEINAMSLIIRNNPDISIDSELPQGTLLLIPVIPNSSVKTDKDLLPPWK